MIRLSILVLICLAVLPAFGGSMIGVEPAQDVIVSKGGLSWVWAAPCAPGGCGTITLHHEFRLPTQSEWNSAWSSLNELYAAFHEPAKRCASPYFSDQWNHCDSNDLNSGYVWHSPLAPDDYHRNEGAAETFLVRGASEVPEPGSMLLIATGIALLAIRRR